MNGSESYLLSICIPTFNRADLVSTLVRDLLAIAGPFEICVFVDGSTDDTIARLQTILSPRLRWSSGTNRGRASALLGAFDLASGEYIMPFDDDDALTAEGVSAVLKDCATPLPDGCCGHVYHLVNNDGALIGSEFPCVRANFLSLRADCKVSGDKKEVVKADILRSSLYDSKGRFRRTPTSLFWSRIALHHDVLCHNVAIGRKDYLVGGMSDDIKRLKTSSAYPQFLLKRTQVLGFILRRYRSWLYASRALAGAVVYGTLALRALFTGGKGVGPYV